MAAADRVGAEVARQRLVLLPSGQHVDPQPLREGHLGSQVRTPAEAVQTEAAPGRHVRADQGPIADDPGAEQRRGLLVVDAVRKPVRVRLVDQTGVGVPAVDVPPGEGR